MTLATGTRVGPYEVAALLGAGGMGEVYLAKDTRLDRTVALKILPAVLASDPEFQARFAREARTISSLDHPHICALHDVGEFQGLSYLVMPYLEGETLATRLERGPLPLDEALRVAGEIASALDHAHRLAIVHRDLKPGNVMLTKTGARLLDFGLAKRATSAAALTGVATTMTVSGTVMGTVPYMAPEQIEGREADARSDLFAFGLVLYEMVTGRRAFAGSSNAGVMGAILRETPPAPSSVVPGIPPALDHVIERCLAKNPDERWASAHDLAIELTWIRGSASVKAATVAGTPSRRTPERTAWALVALLLAITVGVLAWAARKPPARVAVPMTRFVLAPPPGLVWLSYNVPSISPDGRWIVSAAGTRVTGEESLWIRRVDELTLRRVPDPKGFDNPSFPWSPDSRFFFVAGGAELKRVPVDGGSPDVICKLPSGYLEGIAVNGDGTMLIGFGDQPIHRVPAGGGAAEPVLPLDAARGETGQGTPVFLPDGVHYLFESAGKGANRIMMAALGSTGRTELLANAGHPVLVPPGLLLFSQRDQLMVRRFDPSRRVFEGRAAAFESPFAPGAVAASSSGTLVYSGRPGGPVRAAGEVYADNTRLVWFDRTGQALETVLPLGAYQGPQLSPDGRFIAVETFDNRNPGDIWIHDTRRHVATRLTREEGRDADPVWSPTGDRIARIRDAGGEHQAIVIERSDGSEEGSVLHTDERLRQLGWSEPYVSDWSPDGRALSTTRLFGPEGSLIEFLTVDGHAGPPWPAAKWPESGARFSPDGRFVAYRSDETGHAEIYVRTFPPGPGKVRVSVSGGIDPAWRGDGREVYYLTPDRTLMAAAVHATGSTIEIGQPVALFKAPVPDPHWLRNTYVPSKDGRRFLLIVLDKTVPPPAADVIVVSNWAQAMYDELRK